MMDSGIAESKINHDKRTSFFYWRIFFTGIIYVFIYSSCYSQYHAGIGGRVAKFNSGLTMKYFFRPDNATGISVLIAHSKFLKAAGLFLLFMRTSFRSTFL